MSTLAELIAHHRVIVCVGAGGVGKTTLSAAIGLAAARQGRKVLVLTVDPAKRLANALGIQQFDEHVQRIDVELFRAQQCEVAVPMDAAMLDVKRTFDRVVSRYARTPEGRDRILQHPFYQQASTALTGVQEYMASERLYECATSGDYDLVVLDTPPSAHALDFLDAPARLIDLLDSATFRTLLKPTTSLRSSPFRPGSVVMRGLSRFTGGEMFAHLLAFFGDLAETFDGFVQRAREVQTLLRSPETAFVLVSACDEVSVEQARYLRDRLDEQGMHAAAWLMNRSLPFAASAAHAGADLEVGIAEALARSGHASSETAARVGEVARALGQLVLLDRRHMAHTVHDNAGRLPVWAIARSADEPDTLAGLYQLSSALLSATPAIAPGPAT